MRLWAISDLHVGHRHNRDAIERLAPRPDDWLIIAGDVGEKPAHLRFVLETLAPRFAQLVWVPGNHELWAGGEGDDNLAGQARYEMLVELCRGYDVLTPEDPYPVWNGEGGPHLICPLFLLYDYSFRPDDVPAEAALAWAMESGVVCADESYLDPAPFADPGAWCASRCERTEARLAQAPPELPLVLINHFPLHRDMVTLPRIPRFSLWCGTRRTEPWLQRFNIAVVVSGHLHIRSTRWLHNIRFEEVSLGYPRHWSGDAADDYLREILPGNGAPLRDTWYRLGGK